MLQHVGGIDHCVVLVRDLDKAAETFARAGFTVAPRGVHSAHMGTGNNCVMLEKDYFEILGVLTPTEANAKWRAVLEAREGMTAIAMRAHDAEKGAAEVAARGIPTMPVMRFGRPHGNALQYVSFGGSCGARFADFCLPASNARRHLGARHHDACQYGKSADGA